jgi:hypothetical protein
MWAHYKRTFVPMQLGMWLAACLLIVTTRDLTSGFVFLAVMQIGSLLGAALAARVKRLTQFPAAAAGRRRASLVNGDRRVAAGNE